MAEAKRLVLVGFMGAGKSTVGPLVAARLGWQFLDMDTRLEERLGMPVAEVFASRGEESFRLEEETVARELLERERLVVAAGGGAFARAATRELLKHNAVTVFLQCDLETVIRRVPADGRRPLAGNREIMAIRLAERESSYRKADVTVDASAGVPDEVAARVVSAVQPRLMGDAPLR
ncbi:MAG TPA: shikimate kinase [Vicinamibacteria bacterium]